MHRPLPLAGSLFFGLLLGCGGDERLPDEATNAPQALVAGHGAASGIFQEGQAALQVAVAAVFEATRQTGGLSPVTTGRLVQSTAGGPFTYTASSDGKLYVEFFDEDQTLVQASLTFIQALAADNSSESAVLNGDHLLEVRIEARSQDFDYTLRSERVGNTAHATAQGQYTYEGVRYTLDLQYQNVTLINEVDQFGSHFKSTTRALGTVLAPSLELTVDEDLAFELVTTRGGGSSDSASTSEATINNVVRTPDEELRWQNVRIRRNFRDGTVSEADTFWQATGSVLRNGALYGQYSLRANVIDRQNGRGFLYVELTLPDGERVRLESWQQLQ